MILLLDLLGRALHAAGDWTFSLRCRYALARSSPHDLVLNDEDAFLAGGARPFDFIERARTPEFEARLSANMVKHKPLLDRLARDGDCSACLGTDLGCPKHQAKP